MNNLDILLIIVLVLSMIEGFRKGFIEELAALVGLILGIWAALHFSGFVAQLLASQFDINSQYLPIFAFVGIFIGVVISTSILGSIAGKVIKAISLGWLNRLAGLFFGLIKGALILSILLIVFNKFDQELHLLPESTRAASRLYEPLREFAPSLFPFLDFWKEIPAPSPIDVFT